MSDLNFLLMVFIFVFFSAIPIYFAWRYWIMGDLLGDSRIEGWKGLRKKTPKELRLEQAERWRTGGSPELAAGLYREHLAEEPASVEAHLGLADALMDLSIRGTKREPEKRIEALGHYRWALEHYAGIGQKEKAEALAGRLLGPFSREELGAV